MHPAFEVHTLTGDGQLKAKEIAEAFDGLLSRLYYFIPEGRERAIVVTKLEEACFFAKKGMAKSEAD